MPIDYPAILELKDQGRRFSWSDRETMLYALAIGMGADPLDRDELPFVYEKNLKAMPTLATVIAWGASIPADRLGTDRLQTLHGEESLTLHSPLPAAGEVAADSRVRAVYDKGDKGAVIERETVLRDAVSGAPIATIVRTAFARGWRFRRTCTEVRAARAAGAQSGCDAGICDSPRPSAAVPPMRRSKSAACRSGRRHRGGI